MTATWTVRYRNRKLPTLKESLFIEGLPGVGSVGKIAVDFIIDHVGATKIASFSSHSFPPSVFINEQDVVELPAIDLYHKTINNRDVLFLAGDLQPVTEVSCYTFAETIIKELKKMNTSLIITTAGIALQSEPDIPKLYGTGNDEKALKSFKKGTVLQPRLYGKIGPIVGISGVLLCLAKKHNIPSLCVLAETFAHPLYLGISGSRALLEVFNKKFSLALDMKTFDKEVKVLQQDSDNAFADRTRRSRIPGTTTKNTHYIG